MTVPVRWVALVVAAGLAMEAITGRGALLVRPWFLPVFFLTAMLLAVAATRLRGSMHATTALLLLLPVAVGAALDPAVADRAAQASASETPPTARVGDAQNPLLDGRGGDVTLLQVALADQQLGAVALAGREVTLDARTAGAHRLQRSVILCCAADAQAVSLTTDGVRLPASGTWVRVSGHLAVRDGRTVLMAANVTRIPTPTSPFL